MSVGCLGDARVFLLLLFVYLFQRESCREPGLANLYHEIGHNMCLFSPSTRTDAHFMDKIPGLGEGGGCQQSFFGSLLGHFNPLKL